MRNVSLFLIFCTLLLSACSDAYTPNDPNLAAQDARATIGAATAIAVSTAEAERQLAAESTRQAAATRQASEYEMALIDKQIQGTAEAIHAQQTLDARQFAALEATQQVYATQTAWPQTAVPLQATQAAIVASQQYANARADLGVLADVIKFVAALVIMGWTVTTIVKALTNRYRVGNTIYGVVSFDPGVQLLTASADNPPAPVHARYRDIPDVISLTPSGSVLSSPPLSYDERMRRNLENVIKAGIFLAGEDAQQLPRWDKIKAVIPNMSSEKMQDYVDLLEQMSLVEAIPHRGTFAVGGRTLKTILYELQTSDKIPDLSPNE